MSLSDSFSKFMKSEAFDKAVKRLKNDKKALIIIAIGIIGMLIIMFVPTEDKPEVQKKDNKAQYEYSTDKIQQEVEMLIESIKGAGETMVYITYESDMENVYAANTDEKTDGNDAHFKRDYILTDDENGLILKVLYPRVRGVAVVCKGGDDPAVKEKIYSVVSALFDISTNKISVAGMA